MDDLRERERDRIRMEVFAGADKIRMCQNFHRAGTELKRI